MNGKIKIAGVVAGLGLVVAAMTACSPSAMTNTPDASAPAASTPAKATVAKVGSTITLSGNADGSKASVTLVKVVSTTQPKNPDMFTPTAGSRWYAVEFAITNTGKVAYDDAPSNGAHVLNAAGEQFESTITGGTTAGPEFSLSKIMPGHKALGWVVFEVPAKAKITTVQFGMDSGFADTGEWNV